MWPSKCPDLRQRGKKHHYRVAQGILRKGILNWALETKARQGVIFFLYLIKQKIQDNFLFKNSLF